MHGRNHTRRDFLRIMGLGAASAALPRRASAAAAENRPDILLIMSDDQTFTDCGCYGNKDVKTPNIDRLAEEGLRFTSGYAAAATCTPTRFATLTGKYAWRQNGTGIAAPNATAIIQPGGSKGDEQAIEAADKAGATMVFTGVRHFKH